MYEEEIITEFEYDEEGRVIKKKVTRTEQGTDPHPYKTFYGESDGDMFFEI